MKMFTTKQQTSLPWSDVVAMASPLVHAACSVQNTASRMHKGGAVKMPYSFSLLLAVSIAVGVEVRCQSHSILRTM